MALNEAEGRLIAALRGAVQQLGTRLQQVEGALKAQQTLPTTVQQEIDAVPGRRIDFSLVGEIAFTATDIGKRAAPIIMNVSQDGPFVQTHYPLAIWRPSAPTNTTNLNRWRPVGTFPLPDQVVDTDIIDIMYEMFDGGAGRQFQNAPRALLLSRPDNLVPLPIPTMWSPNSNVQFQPTYLSMTFDSATPPTEGILHVELPGYRIVNL